jgi:hypothetical protein
MLILFSFAFLDLDTLETTLLYVIPRYPANKQAELQPAQRFALPDQPRQSNDEFRIGIKLD